MKNIAVGKGLVFLFLLSFSCTGRYPGPRSPEKSLESFELREGFKIELFAAEPYIHDPVSMEFDEQGNAFVVEMPDYPFKPEPGKAKGRIIQVRDTDGDGRVDQSLVFADSLMEATSILPWKGGLIVTTAPDILYLKDTNGDGRADTRETLFSGFFDRNSEAQITSLSFGVDNWIYAANNGQPGEVNSPRDPNASPLSMSGADFRFRMDRNQFERITGEGQFGQTLDDWGNRFYTQNTLHIQHCVIPWKYWHRHPHLPSPAGVINVSDHDLEMFQKTPPPYWRAERTKRRNEAFKEHNLDRIEYAEDHFTGASGGTIYAGDRFPPEYYGNVFTGDVAGNLVHRDILSPRDGSPTFVARRDDGEKNREFLASTDSWFRPANFSQGPDGYLYLIDYYRQHVETPVSVPEDLKADMDFLNGSDLGRIYRISPSTAKITTNTSDLRNKATLQLVNLLAHPSRWWRLQAQRLILERQDLSVIPSLTTLFAQAKDPKVRLHAFYALEGLNYLNADLVKQAMKDASPGVREHGLMLSERFPECLPQAMEKINDPSIRVVFQATLTIGDSHSEQAVAALARVVEKYGRDPWFRMAVLSSNDGSSIDLLKIVLRQNSFFKEADPWKLTFLEDFSYINGSRNQRDQVTSLLVLLSRPEIAKEEKWKVIAVKGLIAGLTKSATATPALKEALTRMKADSTRKINETITELTKNYSDSRQP